MPKYEITAPDGTRYEVSAPNEEALQSAVSQMFGGQPQAPQQPQQQKPMTTAETAIGAAQSGLQGLTAGWADELTGALAAPFAFAAQDVLGGFGVGERPNAQDARNLMGQTQELAKEAYAPQRQFAEENPWTDMALQGAGAITSGVGATKALGAVAPSALARLAQYAATNPYTTAAGTGALSGTLYGAGTADEGNRAQSALTSGAVSAMLGPAVLYGMRAATPAIERGASALGNLYNKLVPVAGQADERLAAPVNQAISQVSSRDRGVSRLPPQPVPRDLASLSTRPGGVVPLTSGQRTQNADIQRLEQAALEGDFGVAPRMQMRDVRTIQNNQIKGLVNELGDAKDAGSVQDVVGRLGETLRRQSTSLGRQVDNAYALARQGQEVRIGRDDIKNGLLSNIAQARREGGYDISRMPEAAAVLKRLGGRVGGPAQGGRVTSVALGELEAIRTQATQAAMRSTDPTERSFLRSMVRNYDNFMSETAANAATEGDAAAINAFKNAVGLRAEFGRKFERNNLVSSIIEGRSVDDLTRDLFGSGVVSGRAEMAKNLQSIFSAAGNDANAVKSDMQTAVMKRLMERSSRGFQEGVEGATPEDFISPNALAKNLGQLIANPEFTKNLYGPQALPVLRTVIKDLELMASKQPGTINTSGTAWRIANILENRGIIDKLPVIGQLAAVIRKGGEIQASQRAAGQVSQGLSEIIKFAPELAPKSTFLTRNAGAMAAGTGAATGAMTGQP